MNQKKTRDQLTQQIEALRARVAELEQSNSHPKNPDVVKTLREREELLEQFFDSASEAVIVVDKSGEIVFANARVEEMFGYARSDLLGQVVEILLPQAVRDKHIVYRSAFALTPHPRPMGKGLDLEAWRSDGTEFPVEVGLGIVDMRGDKYTIAFITDITVRKENEQQREKLIRELDAFAHTIAHELKNPLGILGGFARELNDSSADLAPQRQREYLDIINQSAGQMVNIVDELLLLSQVRTSEVETRPLDMESIVAAAIKRLTYMIKAHEAEVIPIQDWPKAVGYGPWVEEVWVNYLSNAMKYGGRPPRIELGATVEPNGVTRFWVRDNGSGIKPEDQDRLFTQFTRLHEASTSGHGLGLSIVGRIVRKLGGQVQVESEGIPGRGSVFSFTLPTALE